MEEEEEEEEEVRRVPERTKTQPVRGWEKPTFLILLHLLLLFFFSPSLFNALSLMSLLLSPLLKEH